MEKRSLLKVKYKGEDYYGLDTFQNIIKYLGEYCKAIYVGRKEEIDQE